MKNRLSKLLVAIVAAVMFAAGSTFAQLPATATGLVFPGEYESHQAMWMLWPTYENKAGFPSTEPISDMIRAMSGHVRLTRNNRDIYLERFFAFGQRVQVRVMGPTELDGWIGWVDEDDIESAGERCPAVYSPN